MFLTTKNLRKMVTTCIEPTGTITTSYLLALLRDLVYIHLLWTGSRYRLSLCLYVQINFLYYCCNMGRFQLGRHRKIRMVYAEGWKPYGVAYCRGITYKRRLSRVTSYRRNQHEQGKAAQILNRRSVLKGLSTMSVNKCLVKQYYEYFTSLLKTLSGVCVSASAVLN